MIIRFKNWLISVYERIPGWIKAIDELITELEDLEE